MILASFFEIHLDRCLLVSIQLLLLETPGTLTSADR